MKNLPFSTTFPYIIKENSGYTVRAGLNGTIVVYCKNKKEAKKN